MHTRLITSLVDLHGFVRELRGRGKSLALVPTMGALHAGHLSLVRRAKQQCDAVLVSIFVNAKQFNSSEDLARYPRDLEKDTEILKDLNVDGVFAPRAEEMYPAGFDTYVDPGELTAPFEGALRPGHFRGVATIVLKLFNLTQPDLAYFGQKDFQQVQILRRMVDDLNLPLRLVVCPIVRAADGLSLSSRNVLLSPEDRHAATVLHRSLSRGEALVQAGEVRAGAVLDAMRETINAEPRVKLDYLAVVDATTLAEVERVSAGTVALIAAQAGPVRLIDNLIFGPVGASPEALLQLAFATRPVVDPRARIPGLEIEALCRRISACRDCAAMSAVMIPPREFLVKYLRRDYPDLNSVRAMVIGRDAPMHPEHFFYRHPERPDRFDAALYAMLGVQSFEAFKQTFVLTDALRCHVQSAQVPEKALAFCARHLREELKQFPNLQTVVVLGIDAYHQFQSEILERRGADIKPYEALLNAEGWAHEQVSFPHVNAGILHVVYAHHPTRSPKQSPSLASALPPLV